MDDKIDYEHKVYDGANTTELARNAAQEIDRLTTNLRMLVEKMFDELPDAPDAALIEFNDVLGDATDDLVGSLYTRYNFTL